MMPIIVAGSGGDYFKTGRQMTFQNGTDGLGYIQYKAGAEKATGPSQSDLYVSFMNAMGINAQTFGDPALCKGPLAGMTLLLITHEAALADRCERVLHMQDGRLREGPGMALEAVAP